MEDKCTTDAALLTVFLEVAFYFSHPRTWCFRGKAKQEFSVVVVIVFISIVESQFRHSSFHFLRA